eukprot:479718-Prymnesium_polylepis.1
MQHERGQHTRRGTLRNVTVGIAARGHQHIRWRACRTFRCRPTALQAAASSAAAVQRTWTRPTRRPALAVVDTSRTVC